MKRILKGLMCFIILISMIVLALYFLNQKSFPEKYEDVFDSFFKNWKMDEIVIDDVSIPKKYVSRTWKVDYGTDLNKETYIEDKKGLFLTLQNIYIQQNISYFQNEIGDMNSNIYLRNAYDSLLDQIYDKEDVDKNDKQLYLKYTQYYPSNFNVYDENTIFELFEKKKIPLYFIVICKDNETANKLIKKCKKLNAIIMINPENKDIDISQIENAYLNNNNSNDYIFVYNGQIIDDAYTIMSQYHDNKDDYQSYKCGTVLYNYNKFIKEKFS